MSSISKIKQHLNSIHPGRYAHLGKEPNTNKLKQEYEKLQQKHDLENKAKAAIEESIKTKNSMSGIEIEKRDEMAFFKKAMSDKVHKRIQQYEEEVERRRKKLHALYYNEEREFFRETVDRAQRGDESRLEAMHKKAEEIRAAREKQRLELVKEKRFEQYLGKSSDLRPVFAKQRLIETKNCQLQQMRDNEMRREAEKERDKMFHSLSLKEIESKKLKHEQEEVRRKIELLDLQEVWDKQIQGKREMENIRKQVIEEDRVEMEKLAESIRLEEIASLDAKRAARNKRMQELTEQVEAQERLLAKRKEEDALVEKTFLQLTQLEIQKEKEAMKNNTLKLRNEINTYLKYLKELEVERKEEEEQLNKLLIEHQKKIEQKQEEAYCKLVEAREKLKEDVLCGRKEQLKYKQQEAENQLKMQQADNELLRMACDTNQRLQEAYDRRRSDCVKKYRSDLSEQIEYNTKLKQKEREDLERQYQDGLKQEEEYQKLLDDILEKCNAKTGMHPFRRVLNQYQCQCPK